MGRLYETYGFSGEPETRLEREFENIIKTATAGSLENKNATVPNIQTMAKNKPFLVKVSGNWYIYIRIEDAYFKVALTAV